MAATGRSPKLEARRAAIDGVRFLVLAGEGVAQRLAAGGRPEHNDQRREAADQKGGGVGVDTDVGIGPTDDAERKQR